MEARMTAIKVRRLPEVPDEPLPFTRARRQALALESALNERIPSLILHVQPPSKGTVRISIDGTPARGGEPMSPITAAKDVRAIVRELAALIVTVPSGAPDSGGTDAATS